MIGLFAQLTPEQKKRVLEYDGPVNNGPDKWKIDALRKSVMRRTTKVRAFLAKN